MTLPGFNAESSLYKTIVDYRLIVAMVQANGLRFQLLLPPSIDPCGCHHMCCPSGVCLTGLQRSCFLECITFCDE